MAESVFAAEDLRLSALDVSLLDNPIWSALTTGQAALAEGSRLARRFPQGIGPLSGLADTSAEAFAELRCMTKDGDVVVLFLESKAEPQAGWQLVRDGLLSQMVLPDEARIEAPQISGGAEIRRLSREDVPEMVALAKLTEPGPFRERTHELGEFFGMFEGGRLLAMAGQRLHVPGFREVSAVCTHPDARGRGYARTLMSKVMLRIREDGETPILHSFADNAPAIRVYEDLGFVLRRNFELAVLKAV